MEADGSEPVNTKLDSSIASCYVICERMTHCVTKSCYLEARNMVEGGIFCPQAVSVHTTLCVTLVLSRRLRSKSKMLSAALSSDIVYPIKLFNIKTEHICITLRLVRAAFINT